MAALNIPQKVDQWIVFIVTLVWATFRSMQSTGIAFGLIESAVISLLIAGIFTLLYIALYALCRWIARRARKDPDSGRVRIFANVAYGAFFLLSVLPLFNLTVTVDLPRPVSIHSSRPN
jgi:hypothetical protein